MSYSRKNNLRGSFLLLLTAFIWGTAFVAQSTAMDAIGPLLFVNVRFFLGGLVLIPVNIYIGNRAIKKGEITPEERRRQIVDSIKPGILCGIFLATGSLFQQYGLIYTTAGKSAFITALYIVFVPVAGLLFGNKVKRSVILGIFVAVVGFWLLCIKEDFSLGMGDFLTLICALGFTAQIICIDRAMKNGADPVVCSCVEFFTVSVITFIPMLIFEGFRLSLILAAAPSILYTGIFSAGVAYTLQMVGQKETDPALATILMSLESVFAAISGVLLLNETMTGREITGCVLVLVAVLMAQSEAFLSPKK